MGGVSGPFGPGTVYKVREFTSELKFVYNGESAWSSRAANIPGSLSLKDNETVDAALKRHEKPNYAWFERVELPRVLRKPTGSPTFGTTKVTNAGLR